MTVVTWIDDRKRGHALIDNGRHRPVTGPDIAAAFERLTDATIDTRRQLTIYGTHTPVAPGLRPRWRFEQRTPDELAAMLAVLRGQRVEVSPPPVPYRQPELARYGWPRND